MATTDPYALLEETKTKNLNAVNAQQQRQEISRQKQERQYYDALTAQNRGLNITYKQAINPFGKNAEQRGVLGSGVSDYFKNAAYGNLIMGIGQAQQEYQRSLAANQSSWGDFLLKMAGLRTDAENEYTTGVINQRNTDAQLELQRRQMALNEQQYANALSAATGGGTGGDGLELGDNAPTPYTQPQSTFGYTNTYVPRATTQTAAQKAKNQAVIAARGGLSAARSYTYVPRSSLR